MKRILLSTVLVLLSTCLFCQTRTNVGFSAIIPINDSKELFDPGICSDISLTYNITKYIRVNGTIEYINNSFKYLNDRVGYISIITGIGFDYYITPSFQIRLSPNIGTSIIKSENNTSINKMRLGSDISI